MEAAALRNSVPPERATPFFGFIFATIAAGAFASARPLLGLIEEIPQLPGAFWLMAVLAVVGDARPFTPPGRRRVSAVFPSICFTFAILLAYGLGPAVAVQSVAVAVAGWRMRHAIWRSVFNMAQYALALWLAAAVIRIGADGAFVDGGALRWRHVVTVAAAAGGWFLVSYLSVTTAVRLRFGGRWWSIIRRSFAFELLSAGSLLLLGPVLVAAARESAALVPLVVVPLYAVYRMARLSNEQESRARLDPLTGLANRKALRAEVSDQILLHRERGLRGVPDDHLALLLLDLDRFKHINEALGHAVGDRLLVQVGHRLKALVPSHDLVARLGGDEFGILATRLRGIDDARALAERVAAALLEPVQLDGLPLDVAGSIGIAVYPEHGTDFETLMRHADVAMYDAKQCGDQVAIYSTESDHSSPERLSILADLRRAVEHRRTPPVSGGGGSTGGGAGRGSADAAADADPAAGGVGEITMYYQPQIAIATGEVVGVEALLRWQHPRHGMVNPEELIRVAEQSAVMRLLTRRVIDDVIEQLAVWRTAGVEMRAAVNVSVRDLHTVDIVDQIAEGLARHDLPPGQLQLEITEGALMADPRRVLATIAKLDRIGVAIALDDFGTGYSSMEHLRRLPLAEVKVDRSFVLGMTTDDDAAAIVRSVIELAGALGLRVVAEGVEDERTWRLLHDAGCHVAQGWFYARPMPPDELVAWLARYQPLRPDLGSAAVSEPPPVPPGRLREVVPNPVAGPVQEVPPTAANGEFGGVASGPPDGDK